MFGPAAKKSRPAAGSSKASGKDKEEGDAESSALQPAGSASTFSVEDFKASLSEEEKELLELECETMGPTWYAHLKEEVRKSYFTNLKKFLRTEGVIGTVDKKPLPVFPPAKDIYSWSRGSELGNVRVVIIGQDPYHDDGQAHGLCFSVRPGIKIPPSLVNIYKELKTEYPGFVPPKHGCLQSWANNGVLLLNTCLTVRPHKANSHANKGWESFTSSVISIIDKHGGTSLGGRFGGGVVFMAWGAPALKRVEKVNKTKHLVLSCAHPSPLSAHRGFFGNNHFKKANEWLEQRYGVEATVDWCNLEIPKDE
ncbi:hypothetical protein BOTBODRAFT_108964 [Botryobasidium botryosum FD-172 SS1]|uniref:Uracil-DNA glycosylase n=1 Tax=Botryobasidium botryosum (strain FD-172 SS1) TaxID=930990 RepID=A0A067MTS8_BOTB1|nr:hypothetical protein BOTBODRAFT_108964 [Botryobasidium botryosum FD-172 SS1]